MKNKIKVSICCITYNQEDYIEEALDSFVKQKASFDYEIIIHDDASTDNTANIIKSYQKKYPNIIFPIFEKENIYSKHPNSVLDIVFSKARGEYIALCEGDDGFLSSQKIELQAKYMDEHKDISLCSHNTKVVDEDGNFIEEITPYNEGIIDIKDFFKNYSSMHTSSMFFRRKNVLNLPNYYHQATVGDLPLKMYLLSIGNCYHINKVLSFYRTNSKGSWSAKQKQDFKKLKDNLEMEIKIYELFNKDTNYKYRDIVENRIINKKFDYYKRINNLKELKKDIYHNLYKNLSHKEKLKLQIKNIPYIYNIYFKIKYRK